MTVRLEYKQERNLSLDLTNAQVTETGVKDYVLGIGYITKNFRVPFKIRGERKTLKNDLTARLDFTIRDNKTILRRIEDNRSTNTFTNGAMMLQIKPTIDYVVNRRLNLQLYFTRTINAPKVSNAFLNTRTEGGIQLRYNLTP
ncbi:MAG: hypothetical protein EOO03_11860 [Chitinophagaceae bacterium]|nr:MAG: hypothetical protein EOO03_11860 [Chitinophagaceae bacterium]